MVAAAATIASIALPPSRSTATADCAASEWGATAMPCMPRVGWLIGGFSPGLETREEGGVYPTRGGRSVAFCRAFGDTGGAARPPENPRGIHEAPPSLLRDDRHPERLDRARRGLARPRRGG